MASIDPEGLCPIADRAPELWSCNEVAVHIFNKAQNAARQVSAKDKTYLYVRPDDVRSLMEVHGVPGADQQEVLERVRIIEDITNWVRPMHKKTRSAPGGRGRRR